MWNELELKNYTSEYLITPAHAIFSWDARLFNIIGNKKLVDSSAIRESLETGPSTSVS